MSKEKYASYVDLMLKILPHVAIEKCFSLKLAYPPKLTVGMAWRQLTLRPANDKSIRRSNDDQYRKKFKKSVFKIDQN